MKIKKMFLATAFLVALTASFAFKAEKKQFFQNASWIPATSPWACETLGLTDSSCSQYNTGSECTTYDPYSQVNVQAYLEYDPVPAYNCTFPLYHPN